jgi:arylsulfatase A-like enzyme
VLLIPKNRLFNLKNLRKKIFTIQPYFLITFTFFLIESGTNFISSQSIDSPNFILILADDQGWNGTSLKMMDNEPMSKSDYYETPNIELIAKQGMKFSNAYSSAPVCAPSRYSIQFGKSPARLSLIRVGMNTDHIDHQGTVSIPKALKKINGKYQAAHFGKWGMGSSPDTFGYDESDGPTKNKEGGFVNNKEQWEHSVMKDPKKIFSLTEKAVAFMKKNVTNKNPFYLQLSNYAVHSSFQMKSSTLNKYNNKPKGKFQIDAGLAAMTENLDEGIGLILKKIKELGIENNTYVIYMSDNGGVPNVPGAKKYINSYNYPLKRGKWDAMEGGIRVPFVISGPGIEAGKQCNYPVSNCDILPTISSLAGNENEEFSKIDGGSLKLLLSGEKNATVKRSVDGIFFHVPYRNGIALKRPHSAIRKGDFKLIKFQDNGEVLLFNLAGDLAENKDISKINPQKANELEKTLDQYLSDVKAPKWKEGITWKDKPLETFNSHH